VGFSSGLGIQNIVQVQKGVLPLAPEEYVEGELFVKFVPGTPPHEKEKAHGDERTQAIDEINQLGLSRRRVPPGFSVREKANAYKKNPHVLYAEPIPIGHTQDNPNDPSYPQQWALTKIQASSAWNVTQGSSSVIIASADTGLFAAHPDLNGKVVAGYNFQNANGDTTDVHGHGTATAGVMVATTNNQQGVAAIGRNSFVMPLRVCDANGACNWANLAQAIVYAADHGAKVMNMSVATTAYSAALADAVDYAWSRGMVLVAAAGNCACSTVHYPAGLPNVISVSATDQNDVKWVNSNFGPYVKVSAPGQSILTTRRDGTYSNWSGTSFASPHVAGIAALMMAANPALSNQDIVNLIQSSADDIGPAGRDEQFGYGRVNAAKALQSASGMPAPSPTATATSTATPTSLPPTATSTATGEPTATPAAATATSTSTSVATATATSARNPTATNTPIGETTDAPPSTPVPSNTPTAVPPTNSPTLTRTPTSTFTPAPTFTATAVPTLTNTPTQAPTIIVGTPTRTPTPAPTNTPRGRGGGGPKPK
jgi:subtilisin family serine protease